MDDGLVSAYSWTKLSCSAWWNYFDSLYVTYNCLCLSWSFAACVMHVGQFATMWTLSACSSSLAHGVTIVLSEIDSVIYLKHHMPCFPQWIQLQLWERHRLRTLRRTLAQLSEVAQVDEQDGTLTLHEGGEAVKVLVVYFRWAWRWLVYFTWDHIMFDSGFKKWELPPTRVKNIS